MSKLNNSHGNHPYTYRNSGLILPEDIDKDELQELLSNLVESGQISADVVRSRLEGIREERRQRIAQIVETQPGCRLSPEQMKVFLTTLQARFEKNKERHPNISWLNVEARLKKAPEKKLWSLFRMEETGGAPDVVKYNEITHEFIFYDCSIEAPQGRRNLVYDKVVDMAKEMGIEIFDLEEYEYLQKLGVFDWSSLCWLKTPADKRKAGMALVGCRFGDKIHIEELSPLNSLKNRGFRGVLKV